MPARVALAALVLLVAAAPARAATFPPPGDGLFAGVSDGGSKQDYFAYADDVGRHVPVMQAFVTWNAWDQDAIRRWKRTETRGMLSISTSPCYGCAGVISPRAIRRGKSDRYLLTLNRRLAQWGRPTYVRLLPEMNGHWNPYSAFAADGSRRGRSHKTAQFRKAWKRTVIIVRGGPRREINHKLKANRMPPLTSGRKSPRPPEHIPEPKVAFLWVPQTSGSPDRKGNGPHAYWPGAKYVDWIGADTYGKFPNFAGLNDLYRDYRRLPFVIGEWAPWDVDRPGFTRHLFRWIRKHGRAQMAIYYQGFGPGNPFELDHYPRSERALRKELKSKRWLRRAPDSRRPGGGGHSRGGPDGIPPSPAVRRLLH